MAKPSLKKHQSFNIDKDEPVGTVMIGTDHQPICVPGNATITVPGKINNKDKQQRVIYVGDCCSHQFTIRYSC